MKKTIIAMAAVAIFSSCGSGGSKDNRVNPLLSESQLTLNAPEFDKIQDEDYIPAFEEAIKQQNEAIDAILNNQEAPTFENTLVALEKSGAMLDRVSNIFFAISSAHATDNIKKIEEEILPKLTAHQDAIVLNENLFARIKSVYDNEKDKLEGEDKRLLEVVYQNFSMNGALASELSKKRIKEINSTLSTLINQVNNKISSATKKASIIVDNIEELKGLSEAEIAKAKELAEAAGHAGKYMITITNTTQQAILSNIDNRDLRKRILEASMTRGEKGDENDTREDIQKIAELRLEKAKLLGFESFADWTLQNQMAGRGERVINFVKSIVPTYSKKIVEVSNELEKFAKETAGKDFSLEPWDWDYYASRYKAAKFNVDDNLVKEYFVVDSVLENGVFYAANKLFGMTFEKRTDIPVYADDVNVYSVYDKDGSLMALFYTDFYSRPTKRGGAWMSNFVNQNHLMDKKPVIYNVCNYTKPAEGQPALINLDEVTTMFHEFGHALHGLFADQKYTTLSGTNVSRDFVEMPSQLNEHWALEPEVLMNYAKHYKTGETIPAELVQKIQDAYTFDQAYAIGENISSVTIDQAWHNIKDKSEIKAVSEFEEKALKDMGLYNKNVPPRYRSNYFRHVFAGEYSASYYSYIWSEVLDHNVYMYMKKNGGMTLENGEKLRKEILSRGNSRDLNVNFTEMTGLSQPETKDLLIFRGLIKK